MRASDADREQVIADLQRHTAEGRLSLDEFTERAGTVYHARTRAELATITHDLPAHPAPPADPVAEHGRQLAAAFGLALAAVVLLTLFYLLLR
jgi:hypothetical protein